MHRKNVTKNQKKIDLIYWNIGLWYDDDDDMDYVTFSWQKSLEITPLYVCDIERKFKYEACVKMATSKRVRVDKLWCERIHIFI